MSRIIHFHSGGAASARCSIDERSLWATRTRRGTLTGDSARGDDGAVSYESIKYERRGAVALITLDRPDRLNAWTPGMASEQADAIRTANQDDEVGAIVMTGAGRGFCAGADIRDTFKSRLDGTDPGGDSEESGGMPADVDWVGLARESKPLIAAVNGAAVGIGMTMILPFDVIVA